MTDKELIKKLNNLKNFQPDAASLKSNRDILFAQISNSSTTYNPGPFETFTMNFKNIFSSVYQPVLVMAGIVLFLGGGLIFGHDLINVNPSNSLYIAKVISEQARLGLIFNESAKEKMATDFAASHAQSIADALSSNSNVNSADLNTLSDSFKNEVSVLKTSAKKTAGYVAVKTPVSSSSTDKGDNVLVGIANSGKSDSGISIYNPAAPVANTNVCTSTVTDPSAMLDEAEKMFEAKNYSGAASKLKAVGDVLNK
ncbi:MAG: hypothetical protein WCK37_05145 [Candidatus Falkowbacteria bacterium]